MEAMDRRSFLAGTAAVGGGVLVAGLVGSTAMSAFAGEAVVASANEGSTASASTAASASSAASSSSAASTGAAASASATVLDAEAARLAFEEQKAPIPPVAPPAAWDDETEVLVVGSGGGGVFAALRLAMAGYKVTILERESLIGGTTRYGANNFTNLGGHRQANEAGWAMPSFPYDPQKVVEYVIDQQNCTGDIPLLYELAVEGPKCIDWMVDTLGLNWHGVSPAPAGTGSMMMWDADNNFIPMPERFPIYQKFLEDAGVDIRCDSEVVAFVQDGDAIVGLKVVNPDGEYFFHATRAVALLAGGFEVNRALMLEYCPQCCKGIANIATPPFSTGEIFRMGLGVNADVSGFDAMGSFESGIWWQEYGEYDTRFAAYSHGIDGNTVVRQPWLRINKFGDRVPYFSTAGTTFPYQTYLEGVVSAASLCDQASIEMAQPDGKTFVCFDSKYYDLLMADYFGERVCRLVGAKGRPGQPPEMHWSALFETAVEKGGVKKADTIEELEELLGLGSGVLSANVEKWNAACEAGEDYALAYKYPSQWLIPIDEPPYYGAVVGGNPFGTKCGLMINPKMQVIDKAGKVIPGLYAGWHTAGGSSGENTYGGRPGTGIYADGGLSYTGGYMIAGSIMADDGVED